MSSEGNRLSQKVAKYSLNYLRMKIKGKNFLTIYKIYMLKINHIARILKSYSCHSESPNNKQALNIYKNSRELSTSINFILNLY